MNKEHYLESKVYYYDTDAGGVVYYANYLKFLEQGRTEFCLSRGVDTGVLFSQGMAFVVVHVEIDYKSPAYYGQIIKVFTSLEKIGNSSIHFQQYIKRDDTLLIRAKVIWACVDADFKLKSVPQGIKDALLS